MSERHFLLYPGCPVSQSSSCQKVVSCVRLSGASEVTRATHARTTWGPWQSTWGGSLSGKVTYLPEHRPWNRFYKMLTQHGTSWHVLILRFFRLEPVGVLLSSQLSRLKIILISGEFHSDCSILGHHSVHYDEKKNTNGHISENTNKNNLFTSVINCIGYNIISIDFAKVMM